MKKIKKIFASFARTGEVSEALQALTFWEFFLVIVSTITIFLCTILMTYQIIKKQSVVIPSFGGTLKEGVVGEPNIFNPLLSVRDEDQEIVSLVFAGLIHKENGIYVNDLAEEVSKSKDGKSVTVKIKPDLKFQNGDILNADDVVFTISMIKDPKTKSPLKVLWDSIVVTKKDDLTVTFNLKQPYGFFDDMLTVGIISEDIFKNKPREEFPTLKEHQKPVGAGPYKISSVKTSDDKITSVNLKRFKKYNPKAYIKNIKINYYEDEESLVKAFKRGDINIASGVSPESTKGEDSLVINSQLSRAFAIFINRANVNYSAKTIEALNNLMPRELIVKQALNGLGKPIYTPYPTHETEIELAIKDRVDKALALLEADGWKHVGDGSYTKNEQTLSVSIKSPDTDELRAVGDIITTAFREVGIETDIAYINPSIFTEDIIRKRDFDFVLFGQVLHTPADLYAFWHSSQKNDPGLNIGSYSNKTVDSKLEALLKETDTENQNKLIIDINNLIKNDTGALFVFSPKYIVMSDKKADIFIPQEMSYSKDRYQNIYKWSIEQERILKFLNH
ncbi:MAG: peptide ABC transporter substrate-binding protein [Candidatus Pacebacteria bacterium]|nr:peptide ABC transporter substrate-binding protein [Candidatus Paceibacterota bacterium]